MKCKMKLIYSLLSCIIAWSSCKNTDAALVSIPSKDGTKPALKWELEIETMGDKGSNTSVMTLDKEQNIAIIHKTDKAQIYLVSTDEESGIVHSALAGEFDFLCLDPNKSDQGTNSHGTIPGNSIDFAMLKIQGMRSWKLDGYRLLSNFECGAGYNYSKGKFELNGMAVNHLKDTARTQLSIQVIP